MSTTPEEMKENIDKLAAIAFIQSMPPLLKNTCLTSLQTNRLQFFHYRFQSIISPQITDEVFRARIIPFLRMQTKLTVLNCYYHQIKTEGAKELAEYLKTNNTLSEINLANNCIGKDAATLILNVVATRTLNNIPITVYLSPQGNNSEYNLWLQNETQPEALKTRVAGLVAQARATRFAFQLSIHRLDQTALMQNFFSIIFEMADCDLGMVRKKSTTTNLTTASVPPPVLLSIAPQARNLKAGETSQCVTRCQETFGLQPVLKNALKRKLMG